MAGDLSELGARIASSIKPHIDKMAESNISFRKIAESHNESVKNSVKDIYNALQTRAKDIASLSDSLESNSQQTQQVAFEVRSLNTMFQQSVALQFQLVQEIRNLEKIVQMTSMQQVAATNASAASASKIAKSSLKDKILGVAGTAKKVAGYGAAGVAAGVAAGFTGHAIIKQAIDSYRNAGAGESIGQSMGAIGDRMGSGGGGRGGGFGNGTSPGGWNNGPGANGPAKEENTGALKDIDKNQLAFLRGIGAGETGFDPKQAYSETHNSPNDVYDENGRRIKVGNVNVRKYGQRGADYGHYQNNEMDVEDAIKHGVPPEIAKHLHGGGAGGKSTIQEQTLAMHEYIKRKYPDRYEALKSGSPEAFESARQAMGGKWFALRDNKPAVQEGFNRRSGGDYQSIFPEVVDKDKLYQKQGNIDPQTQKNRPDYWRNTLTFGDQQYRFGTGAPGADGSRMKGGSVPYGEFDIKQGLHTDGLNPRFKGNSFYVKDMFDQKWGRNRVGVLLHSAGDLEKLYTAGCLGIDPRQWPAFKRQMLEQMKKNGDMVLQVNTDGSAKIMPKSEMRSSLPTQSSDNFVNTGNKQGAYGASDDAKPSDRTFFDTNKNYNKKEIDSMVNKYGSDITIGGNPLNEGFDDMRKYIEGKGAQSHEYYKGRGEPANGYNNDGKIQFPADQSEIKQHLAETGMSRKQWDQGGWLDWHRNKLLQRKPSQFEWDNPSYGKDPNKMLQFLGEHQNWASKNNVKSKMFLKNLSPEQYKKLNEAFESYNKSGGKSGLNPALFSKTAFGEYEKDHSQIKSVEEANKAGIQVYPSLNPNDTNYYATPPGGIPAPPAAAPAAPAAAPGAMPGATAPAATPAPSAAPATPAPPPVPAPAAPPPPPPPAEAPATREKTSSSSGSDDKGTIAGWVPSLVRQVEGYYNSRGRHKAGGVE